MVCYHVARSQLSRDTRFRCLSMAVLSLLVITAWLCVCEAELLAQTDAFTPPAILPQAQPEDLGLQIPDGDPIPGSGRRVLLKDSREKLVVGRVHVEIGDRFLVMLPNGRLVSVPKIAATVTDRPFKPVTKDEIVEELTGSSFKNFKTDSTARFLYIYNTSEAFKTATSRILETMYPTLLRYCKGMGLDVHDPEFPLVVVMFRSREEFDHYMQVPPGISAYYSGISNYVVMYEESEMTRLAPALALKTSISTIAHEGVHQILLNIGVQQRLSKWPAWISEGLPEYFAPTETGRRVRWKGLGLVHDMRMHHLIEVAKQESHGGQRWFHLDQHIKAEDLDALGYAKAWATVYWLAKFSQKKFKSYLQEVSRLQPLEEPPHPGAFFESHFGRDYAGLEEKMLAKLQKVKYVDPIENQTYFVGIFENREEKRALVALSPVTLNQWRSGIGVRGHFKIEKFLSKSAARNYVQRYLNSP